jgi:hypothetical protein
VRSFRKNRSPSPDKRLYHVIWPTSSCPYTEVARWGNRERHVLLLELRLSRHCHGSRGKTSKNRKQKVNMEEKLALAVDRNCLILLGKLPLRQIVIKLLKSLLTGGLSLSRIRYRAHEHDRVLRLWPIARRFVSGSSS